jgi:hypothetical protein
MAFWIAVAVLVPSMVSANLVMLNLSSWAVLGVVVFWSFVVEAGMVALLLAFRSVAPLASGTEQPNPGTWVLLRFG